MRNRRGFSLLELLLIMSACTMVLTLTGVLLHRVMQIQMRSRAHVNAERSALRLSNQFRRDVHQARAAVLGDADARNTASLRLELDDGRVAEYSHLGDAVLRVESGSSKPPWREEFPCSAGNQVKFAEQSKPPRLVLTITAAPAMQPAADAQTLTSAFVVPVSVHAEAIIGRDLRFIKQPAEEGAIE